MRRLTYVLPTVYLVIVFTAFQAISISSAQRDSEGQTTFAPTLVYALTLPWSLLSGFLHGSLAYLPMVAGAPLNAGVFYFLLAKSKK